MSKSSLDKRVNREAKKLNRTLERDVFKDRFYVRQYRKTRSQEGTNYYLYELCDREQPERNHVIEHWYSAFALITFNDLWMEMNDFIIQSDFWAKHRQNA